jgi:2-oxo-4-hydroxy-4-carboxy--5-ureidoimidazoline (OHCU) decarboxylase
MNTATPLSKLSLPVPAKLQALNDASLEKAQELLSGLYEHSDWIAHQALAQRPFRSVAQLKAAMCAVLDGAGREAQLALVRAHPELAGKAMLITKSSSTRELEKGEFRKMWSASLSIPPSRPSLLTHLTDAAN